MILSLDHCNPRFKTKCGSLDFLTRVKLDYFVFNDKCSSNLFISKNKFKTTRIFPKITGKQNLLILHQILSCYVGLANQLKYYQSITS